MINADAGLAGGTDNIDEGEVRGMRGDGLRDRVVVGGDDVVGGLRRGGKRGLPAVVV